MTKKQKSVSIPLAYWESLVGTFKDNEEALRALEIDSPSRLLRVLANLGKPALEKLVEEFYSLARSGAHEDLASQRQSQQLRKLGKISE